MDSKGSLRIPKDIKDSKDSKDSNDSKDSKESRDFKGTKDSKDSNLLLMSTEQYEIPVKLLKIQKSFPNNKNNHLSKCRTASRRILAVKKVISKCCKPSFKFDHHHPPSNSTYCVNADVDGAKGITKRHIRSCA